MKIDMNPSAVTLCLKQVNQLRGTCLALANSSVGQSIRKEYAAKDLPEPACPRALLVRTTKGKNK